MLGHLFESHFLTWVAAIGPIVFVPACIAVLDLVMPLRASLKWGTHSLERAECPDSEDFTILVPIFGDVKYLKNVDFLRNYGSRVVLCTTCHESPEFYQRLRAIADAHEFRIFESPVREAASSRPNPWGLFKRTLERPHHSIDPAIARDEIVRDSFAVVTSRYTIFLDGDTTSSKDFRVLIRGMARQGLDIASVRILPSATGTVMERLQHLEYSLAMDARRLYPWLTSGACMVAKTYCIRDIMRRHSLFFSGGDIEIGKLARLLHYRVGHIRFPLHTDVPAQFSAWFRQRTMWASGGFRHAVVNAPVYSWRHPFFFLYTTVVVYLLTPVRWYEIATHPSMLPIVVFVYWVLLAALRWRDWQWVYLLFPLYALCQVMVVIPFGVVKYIRTATHSRNAGVITVRRRGATDPRCRGARVSRPLRIPSDSFFESILTGIASPEL